MTITDVEAARDLLAGVAVTTPVERSRWLGDLAGAEPGKAAELYGVVKRRAARPLPSYRF